MPVIHRSSRPTIAFAACMALAALAGCGGSDAESSAPGELRVVSVLGEPGNHNGQFIYPRGMDIFEYDAQPYAVIVDKTARIQMINLDTGDVMGVLHTPRWDRGKPTGLTVANSLLDPGKLAVYVADTHEHRVLVYELPLPATDQPVPTEPDFQFGGFGEGPGQFIYPTDIAVDADEQGRVRDIYVSEYGGNDRINHFTVDHATSPPALTWISQIGVVGEEVDASDHPLALARPQSIELRTSTTGQRELVVTDASHHRWGRMTLDDQLIAWHGDPLDTSDGAYRFPYGLTLLEDGTALIAEFGGNVIRLVDVESGRTLLRYGVAGRAAGQLAQPWAVGAAGGRLVILDSGNSRVQICDLPKGVGPLPRERARPAPVTHSTGSAAP